MPDYLNWPERVAAKARSRQADEKVLISGSVSPADMSRINGGGMIARGAVRLGKSVKAQRILSEIIDD